MCAACMVNDFLAFSYRMSVLRRTWLMKYAGVTLLFSIHSSTVFNWVSRFRIGMICCTKFKGTSQNDLVVLAPRCIISSLSSFELFNYFSYNDVMHPYFKTTPYGRLRLFGGTNSSKPSRHNKLCLSDGCVESKVAVFEKLLYIFGLRGILG